MKILTLIAQVPGQEERFSVRDGKVDLSENKLVMDTMDEYGLEEALRLRDAGVAAEIVAVGVGPVRLEDALRAALAMGADRAVHVLCDVVPDPIAMSKAIAAVAKTEQADLILCGGQQAGSDSQAIGPAVAARLGWPQATWTNALKLSQNVLTGRHDVNEGVESFEVSLPAVVTAQQGLNEPRYPTLPGIMKAKKKEIRREPLESFGVAPMLRVTGAEIQSRERKRMMLDGKNPAAAAAELVKMLRNEAKVLA